MKWVFPKNSGTPQIIQFNKVFHYKPSILGYPYFWKHPNDAAKGREDELMGQVMSWVKSKGAHTSRAPCFSPKKSGHSLLL